MQARLDLNLLETFDVVCLAGSLKRAAEHVKVGGTGEEKARYADVLWALLNGVEFRTNH